MGWRARTTATGGTLFYRFNQSFQYFFDVTAQIDTTFQ